MSLSILLLEKKHNRKNFDCGNESLSRYIKTTARQDVKNRISTCFVLLDNSNVVKGYYTLSNSSIPKEDIPEEFVKRIGKYDILPVTLLGRLAIDNSMQGQGQGETLLIHALEQAYRATTTIASLAVIVDPIDEDAIKFYLKYGFIQLPGSPRMFIPMRTVEKLFPST